MFELIDPHPPVNVQEAEYRRLLGYPKQHVPDGRARELAGQARAWYAENGKPWIYTRQTSDLELKNKRLWMHETEFASKQLHDQFIVAHAHTAVLVAVAPAGNARRRRASSGRKENRTNIFSWRCMAPRWSSIS